MKIQYHGEWYIVKFGKYANGNTALFLEDEKGFMGTVASINITSIATEPDVIGVKWWSENEGMIDALIMGGVIEPLPLFQVPSGHVVVPFYRLTPIANAERENQYILD